MRLVRFWVNAAVSIVMVSSVGGHGRLSEPPSRATAWRFGFPTPHDYNDHELYCGGFARQWHKNKGMCGVCGDPYDTKPPRPHEYGGKYGQGVIVRKYMIDSVVELRVELTANHNGFFEFRICPDLENTTQECLDKYLLNREDGQGPKYYPKDGNKIYSMRYKLPQHLECTRCVLQWRYIAGNNWGTCADGTGAVGCGPQEEFRACADISIGKEAGPLPPPLPPPSTTTIPTTKTTKLVPEDPKVTQDQSRSHLGLVVSLLALFASLLCFAILYLYYYRCGDRIKFLLKKKSPEKAPPMRPPRAKKATIDNLEPGFKVVDLSEN